jgi:[ribosomal protein S5]-alanine N-acetyltransferase
MLFALRSVPDDDLRTIAAGQLPHAYAACVEVDALPPPFVAARALRWSAEGLVGPWCTSFLIVRQADGRVVGGCGFKAPPRQGRAEIGYGVAPAAQKQGAATAAVLLLVPVALGAGVSELLAEVAPTNVASTKVVKRTGFRQIGQRVDEDGERVVQWLRPVLQPGLHQPH